MSPDPELLPALEQALRVVADAPSSASVFTALVEESRAAVPRAALFLLRHERIKGWSCHGYSRTATRHLGALDLPADRGWPGPAALEREAVRPDGVPGPDFGQGAFDESIALPLRVAGTAIAFLLLERARGEAPFELAFVRALALLCELRLELDLARRKAARERSADATARDGAREPAVAAPAAEFTADTGLALPGEDAATEVDARLLEAQRFARLVATDIRLYNEEAVLLGRRQKDLASRLADQLKRGKESFSRRFSDLGPQGLRLLEEAYVEVLAAGDPHALSR